MTEVEKNVQIEEPEDPAEPSEPAAPEKPAAEFTQEDVDRIVSERLEREKRKSERAKEDAERAAREQALKDNEDWKKLAGEHAETISSLKGRIDELETVEGERDASVGRIEALEKRLAGILKPKLESVDELYRPFVEKMSVEEQAEWFEKNQDKLGNPPNGRPAGSPRTGPPANRGGDKEADKEAREQQRLARVSSI